MNKNDGVDLQQWLALTDYASKYRVSVSTLRRRIKGGLIEHRFEDGKYLLLDVPPSFPEATVAVHSHITNDLAPVRPRAIEALPLKMKNGPEFLEDIAASVSMVAPDLQPQAPAPADEPILSSATRLLSELKRAYMNVLHEKEEQIVQLKEEVSDLKTLVRVLEDENERLSR